ncbi:MAG: EAL domain-containing protein [Campylobacterales bacterium]|nr:EAL domain-containing protein [Campylobacterales bacterium]
MALLKKNVWLIFYILGVCATLLFASISYLKYKNISFHYQNAQENIVEIVSNATYSLFDTHERLMDIIGVSILQNEHHLYESHKIEHHARPLLDNPTLGAFGVTKPNGEFIYASTDPNPKNLQSLLSIPESRDSFLETLTNPKMTFGRTYFSPSANLWGMPLRKTLRDPQGNPVAVMTALLRSNIIYDNIISTVKNKENLIIFVVRDRDLYFQYHSQANHVNKVIYDTPLSSAFIDTVYENASKHYHLSSSTLRENERIVSFIYEDSKGEKYLTSLKFNNTYQLWVVSHTQLKTVMNDFLQTFIVYFVFYLGFGTLFFFLFKMIATAEEKRRKDLVYQATHDPLTALPNRNYLQQRVTSKIDAKEATFSLLYIDMDHFKNINDSFGHQFGDYVLIEIAHRLNAVCSKDTIVTRYGGDEFIIVAPLAEHDVLMHFAASLIEALSKPYHVHDLVFSVGASVGIALCPYHGRDLDTLLRSADIALYESKKIKNTAHIFADTMQEGFLKNIQIEQALRSAISNGELFLVYQPQVDKEGTLYGIEALARWKNPTLGMVPPDCFIPLAETVGLMPQLGKFILETACFEIKPLQECCCYDFKLSINISVRQFMEPSFYAHLLTTIEASKMSNLALTLEITENLFIEDIHYLIPLLQQIRALGIEISMDDFGTGYSSLSMLKKLPIDELKIDKSFIDGIQNDEMAQKMVQNIITIGKNFGMRILAEGVETQEQKALLLAFGCDYFQGYYFSKPLAQKELEQFLRTCF